MAHGFKVQTNVYLMCIYGVPNVYPLQCPLQPNYATDIREFQTAGASSTDVHTGRLACGDSGEARTSPGCWSLVYLLMCT